MKRFFRTLRLRFVLLGAILLLNTSCGVLKHLFGYAAYVRGQQVEGFSYSPGEGGVATVEPSSTIAAFKASGLNQTNNVQNASASALFVSGESQEAVPGFSMGLLGEVPINTKLSAITGLAVTTKGSEFETGASNTVRRRLTYIDIPINLQYELKPRFYVNGGLQPSILLGAKRISDSNDDDIGDLYKTFDLAATLGVGYNFNNDFGLRLQYDHGLVNILQGSSSGEVGNRAWRLGLTYKIKSW